MICHKKTGLEHVGTLTEFLVEPFAPLGITLKISKKVMPKHHQCHVVCWPMTKKERKKKNSFIMKKCRDAFQNEEKCLEQAVHGNCKWCEGLCGPSEV